MQIVLSENKMLKRRVGVEEVEVNVVLCVRVWLVCLQNNELLGIKSTFSFLPLSLFFSIHTAASFFSMSALKITFGESVCLCVWRKRERERRISCLHVYVY
jgi:hypothetical protein